MLRRRKRKKSLLQKLLQPKPLLHLLRNFKNRLPTTWEDLLKTALLKTLISEDSWVLKVCHKCQV